MQFVAIVLMCVVAAVGFGIGQNMITTRVCLEYFTIGHPDYFGTDDPNLLSLGWGFIASWWVGVLLGVPLALCARAGSRPKIDAKSLVGPLLVMLAVMAVCALLAGVVGWQLARHKWIEVSETMRPKLDPGLHVAYLADLWSHSMTYLAGVVGAIVVMVRTWRKRGRLQAAQSSQPS